MPVIVAVLLSVAFGISFGNQITQTDTPVFKTEGERPTLECTFRTTKTYYYLHWFRQSPGTTPQFITFSGSNSYTADFAKQRFSSTADKNSGSTSLTITGVVLEDSAVYYCALQRTTGGSRYTNKLIFGTGTTLTVRPKRSDTVKGTLNVLQPFDDKGPTACLASMYFDNDGDMTLTDNNDKVSSHSKDLALLSKKDRLYYLAGVSDNGIKSCTHKGRASQKKQDSEKATTATPTVETEECQSRNDTAKKDTKDFAKLNFMSLTVNGLRMLFAKTVTFNMLMTVRAMII